jgi:hypothetical protein
VGASEDGFRVLLLVVFEVLVEGLCISGPQLFGTRRPKREVDDDSTSRFKKPKAEVEEALMHSPK